MKGIILAGGLGTRLYPLTKITNKHLLPVLDRPMIYYPLQTLINAGIRDILIVTGGNNAGDFLRLLGNGKEFGLKHINYTYQEGEGGIAAALDLAYVAAGRFDAFWESGLSEWDMAAGALLIQEAGGLVSDFTGGHDFLEKGHIVAGNTKCFKAVLTAIQPHLPASLKR